MKLHGIYATSTQEQNFRMEAKVYLLLRTHNRSEEFQNCIASISKQSILPEVVVISDDESDQYIHEVTIPNRIFRPIFKKPRWWIRHHNPFNDYFNQALSIIPDGNFIYYLDDDDELVDKDWVKTILTRNEDVLIGRFQLGKSHNNKIIGEKVIRGEIGGSCIALRTEIARANPWPSRGAGDYFFIKKVVEKHSPVFIDMVAGKVQTDLQHSWGVRKSY